MSESNWVSYDVDKDEIVFVSPEEDDDDRTIYHLREICISREVVLQFLLDMSRYMGEKFTVFKGAVPGEQKEDTEMTFLCPPTSQCITEGDE